MIYKPFDIGFGYLKFIANDQVVKVLAVIAKLGDTLNDPDCDIVTVDGIRYVVGEDVFKLGKKPMTANESKNRPKNIVYKVLGLYALLKMGVNEQCTVVTGLPHQQLKNEADLVKEVFKGSHKVNLNGRDIDLEIVDAKVASQGYGTYQVIEKQRGKERLTGKKKLLADMGFRTIILMPILNGSIDKDRVVTLRQMGIQRAYMDVVSGVNQEFNKNYKFYRVDEFLDQGVPLQDEDEGIAKEVIAERDYVTHSFDDYSKDVWQEIYDKYDDDFLEELDEIIFTGGSAERIEKYLSQNARQNCSFIDESQDAQVKGYGIIAEKLAASQVQVQEQV